MMTTEVGKGFWDEDFTLEQDLAMVTLIALI